MDRRKNLLKYALDSVAAVGIIALVIFGVATGTSSGGEGSAAPDFEVRMFKGIEGVGFREGNFPLSTASSWF